MKMENEMKNKAIYPLIIISFFMLTGCGTFEKKLGIVQLQNQASVENNLFSSSFPELKLQMNRELKYLGSVQIGEKGESRTTARTDSYDNMADATAYLFGQMDPRKRITRGVLIRRLVMHGDPSQALPEIFTQTHENTLESGEMKILKAEYQYKLYTEQELFTEQEKELLKNIRVPSCFLVKQLAAREGFGNKSQAHVLYFEDASNTCEKQPCGACLNPNRRTEDQKQFIQGFTDRSFASIRFLQTKTVEDTTSRYVDTVPKAQTAPPVTAPPVSEPAKADTAEKRLEALKRLYEKNLISQEDYEKKKAEILKEL
jgi:hypothetical protein